MMEAWEMFENLRARCEKLSHERLVLKAEIRKLREEVASLKGTIASINRDKVSNGGIGG